MYCIRDVVDFAFSRYEKFLHLFLISHRRNLDHFLTCMQSAVNAVDPETGGGELTIRIPKEVLGCAHGKKNMLLFCCSRKYPYPSHGKFCSLNSLTPPEIPF